jgi:hypothetical protein
VILCHGDILVSSVWGWVFCPWSAKFQPSPLCSHPISPPFLHEEDYIHSCLLLTLVLISEEDHIHSKFEPNPTVRGRGVSTKAPWFEKRSSTISACLLVWFWFSVRTCRCLIDVAFHFWIVSRRIDEDVWRILFPGIIDIHTCLGTRIGIWFIYGLFGYYIYIFRRLRCDAGEPFGFLRGRCGCFCPC